MAKKLLCRLLLQSLDCLLVVVHNSMLILQYGQVRPISRKFSLLINCIIHQVFEGTSGIDNKYTTVQFTGEVLHLVTLFAIYLSIKC